MEEPKGFEVRHRSFLFGLDPTQGRVTVETERVSSVVRYLNRFIGRSGVTEEWTTVRVLRLEGPRPQSEVQVAAYPVWIMALGDFQGGGLWIEDLLERGPLIREFPDGRTRSGHVRELCNSGHVVVQGQGYAM